MLGNSFTYFCDLPGMLSGLLQAEVRHHTRGGAVLAEHLDPASELGGLTQAALHEEKWDYVVLQEYSTGPLLSPESFRDSVGRLCSQIRENGAMPLLYATWAFRKDGKKLEETGLDYDEMYRGLYEAYHLAAEENRCPVADVGKAFYEYDGREALYASDDYHPSPAGSRLAARTIADRIGQVPAQMPAVAGDDSRIRILFLHELLRRHTDEDHPLSGPEILERMQESLGARIHRTTLPRDIEVLRAAGIDVRQSRHKTLEYHLAEQSLSLPELRILIDAVQSSKFITESRSRELVEKLMALTNEICADRLRGSIHTIGRAKSDNEKGYAIVSTVSEAIVRERKISFYYCDYDNQKRRVRKNNGAPYTVSPYDLIWDGDFYYLTGFCDERDGVRVFRADRIDGSPTLMESAAVTPPPDYRAESYTREVFRMYATRQTAEVRLLCDSGMMKVLIDKFGADVPTAPLEDGGFHAVVRVCPGPTFYRWLFGWGSRMKLEGPEEIVDEYRAMLLEELRKI